MLLIPATLSAVLLLLPQDQPPQESAAPDAVQEPAFLDNGVVAEGGHSQLHPENTLVAIQSALDLGVAWIQVDVQRTQDGKFVLLAMQHAISQDKAVAERSWEELAALDVAVAFRKKNRKDETSCPPHHAPTLDEVLDLIQAQNKTRLLINPFPDIMEGLTAHLDQRKAVRWVGIYSGSSEWLAAARAWNKEVPLFWQRPITSSDDQSMEDAKDLGLTAMVFKHDGIEGERVPTLQAAGWKVGAYAVPGFLRMEFLVKQNVDYYFVANIRHMMMVLKQQSKQGSGSPR